MPERSNPRSIALALAAATTLLAAPASGARAQDSAAPDPDGRAGQARQAPQDSQDGEPRRLGDPWEAYAGGEFDRALDGFIDRQVTRPGDPALALNVGASHYKMNNWAEAERAFSTAASSASTDSEEDRRLRSEAFYNLGNVAYRQGRLQEAVEHYRSALELHPDDEDAKFNLEFVRDEIRRRVEDAQERQQQQQQQQEGQQQQQPGQDESQESGGDGTGRQESEPGSSSDTPEGEPEPSGTDSDGDGLPDETERSGENPTDPNDADTDRDGLPDGYEDANRNGALDEGETDPNRADSDGDGTGDAAERAAAAGWASPAEDPPPEGLTREEAERYLQALEERRPDPRRRAPRGRSVRPGKDW